MNNIYNLLADLCSHVIKNCDENFFVQYSCVSKSETVRLKEYVNKKIPELIIESGETFTICQLDNSFINSEKFKLLSEVSEEFKKQNDYFSLVGFIQILDESLETLLKEKFYELEQDSFTVVLNTNRETTGIGLLPRCSCAWERKHRLSQCYNRMDNFLFNLLLMENVILEELIDKHIFLKQDFFKTFPQNRTLKIAATPLRLEGKYEEVYYERNKTSYLKVEYDEPESEQDNLLIWNKILLAQKEDSDIIVFPEVLGNFKTVSFIKEKINALSDEEKKRLPALIILPSVWKDRKNIVTILDRNGNTIAEQYKQNPYRTEKIHQSYLEDIIPNNVINIFHYEGIGRFAVLICKDFLTTKYMERLMRCFKLTLIIVPSYSSGSYDFKQSFDLCAHDDCNVIWINSCAAVEEGRERNMENIGYIRKRIGIKDDQSQTLCNMPSCQGIYNGKCNHDCIFFEEMKGVH